jgi:CHAT domain-containing protein
MLAESRADIRQGVNPELVSRERALQDLLNGKADALLQARQRKGGEAQAAAIAKDIDALTGELQQLQTRIRQQSPRYATLAQPQPLNVKDLQTRVLDDNTVLLEYALGEDRSYLWAVTPTSLRSYVLPKRAEIEAAAQEVYRLLTVRNQAQRRLTSAAGKIESRSLSPAQADAQYWRAARQLSRMILQPVAAQLGRKRLVIVAEGTLQYVPFGALPDLQTERMRDKENERRRAANRKAVSPSSRLPVSLSPLVINHEIINLPSASSLAVMREEIKDRQAAPRMIAVFADPVFDKSDERLKKEGSSKPMAQAGDNGKVTTKTDTAADVTRKLIVAKLGDVENGFRIPRLPFTRNEAERIVKTSSDNNARISMDFAARRTALFDSELSQYRVVHIATHGLLDAERPELSSLIFSLVDEQGKAQNGFLRAHEIYNLNLPAELVVLSACETGLGKQVRGEGLVGLTRGFMYAGAPRVVVSLWSVSDRATSELMAKFYRKLLAENARPAEALRAAQIAMWNEGRWRAPYYWAAFTLQGEWR